MGIEDGRQPEDTTESYRKIGDDESTPFLQLFNAVAEAREAPDEIVDILASLQVLPSFEEYVRNRKHTENPEEIIEKTDPKQKEQYNSLVTRINAELPEIKTSANEQALQRLKAFYLEAEEAFRPHMVEQVRTMLN